MNENKIVKGMFAGFSIFWMLSLLVNLGLMVAVVCVVWHFIAKWW